jgi:hypothetical protein
MSRALTAYRRPGRPSRHAQEMTTSPEIWTLFTKRNRVEAIVPPLPLA